MGSTMYMSKAEHLHRAVETTKEAPFIQIGKTNLMTFHDIVGQVTQVGSENIVNFLTEKKKYRLTIKSRSKDVETEICYNIISPNKDLPALDTNTLMLGATAESPLVQDNIEMRIDVEDNDTRHRLRTDEETLSQTRSCLSSLFRSVNMAVQWLREGSIIIGLQPTTPRAVFTLMKAMEEGFLKDLVQNILEKQIARDTDCSLLNVDEPIKMKFEVNIPKEMLPKNFNCRQYSSMAEVLKELSITNKQQMFKKDRKRAAPSKIKEVELAKLLIERSEEETKKREETVVTLKEIAGKVETLGTSLNIAFGLGGVLAVVSLITAPFTFGGSVAAAGVGGAALVVGFLVVVAKVIDEIKAQKKFNEYENVLAQLVEALIHLLDTEDKESVRRSLNEALKDKPINAKNQTLKILLEDINDVRMGEIFIVTLDDEQVLLKDFDVLQYIKKRIKKREKPSIIGTDLRKLANQLDQYEVLVNRVFSKEQMNSVSTNSTGPLKHLFIGKLKTPE